MLRDLLNNVRFSQWRLIAFDEVDAPLALLPPMVYNVESSRVVRALMKSQAVFQKNGARLLRFAFALPSAGAPPSWAAMTLNREGRDFHPPIELDASAAVLRLRPDLDL